MWHFSYLTDIRDDALAITVHLGSLISQIFDISLVVSNLLHHCVLLIFKVVDLFGSFSSYKDTLSVCYHLVVLFVFFSLFKSLRYRQGLEVEQRLLETKIGL